MRNRRNRSEGKREKPRRNKEKRKSEEKLKAKEREDAKARKAEEKAQRQASTRKRTKSQVGDVSDQGPSHLTSAKLQEQNQCACNRPTAKRPQLDENNSSDMCCVCLQAFEDDIEAGAGVD